MVETQFNLQPTLENELLVLRPLRENEFEALYAVASDPLIWEQHPQKDRCKRDVFEMFFKEAIESGGAFAVMDKNTGEMIGSTRFNRVKESADAIEIGWTFLARSYWGGNYNGSMKRLLLYYAFNDVTHVLFYIGENNWRSRKAVEKIGGQRIFELEGKQLDPRGETNVIYAIDRDTWKGG